LAGPGTCRRGAGGPMSTVHGSGIHGIPTGGTATGSRTRASSNDLDPAEGRAVTGRSAAWAHNLRRDAAVAGGADRGSDARSSRTSAFGGRFGQCRMARVVHRAGSALRKTAVGFAGAVAEGPTARQVTMKLPFVPQVVIKISLIPRPATLLRVFAVGSAAGIAVAAAIVGRLLRPSATGAHTANAGQPTPTTNAASAPVGTA